MVEKCRRGKEREGEKKHERRARETSGASGETKGEEISRGATIEEQRENYCCRRRRRHETPLSRSIGLLPLFSPRIQPAPLYRGVRLRSEHLPLSILLPSRARSCNPTHHQPLEVTVVAAFCPIMRAKYCRDHLGRCNEQKNKKKRKESRKREREKTSCGWTTDARLDRAMPRVIF